MTVMDEGRDCCSVDGREVRRKYLKHTTYTLFMTCWRVVVGAGSNGDEDGDDVG